MRADLTSHFNKIALHAAIILQFGPSENNPNQIAAKIREIYCGSISHTLDRLFQAVVYSITIASRGLLFICNLYIHTTFKGQPRPDSSQNT